MVKSELIKKARRSGVTWLAKRETWNVLQKQSLPPRPNILGGRFVLILKTFGATNEFPKALYVAQGHLDLDKQIMMHSIKTLRQSSSRTIISVGAIKNFRLFSHNVTQGYLRSNETLTSQAILSPKKKNMEHFRISEYK